MPFGYELMMPLYVIFVVGLMITLAVVVIRLMLAATRALNAYTEDRKLRTALVLDESDPADNAVQR